MKISRTGLLCLILLCLPALGSAQGPQGSAEASADQQPAQQAPAPQAPAQQTPPPAPAPPPAQQPPAEQQPPPEAAPQPGVGRLKLPPAPPKVVDVRMPGEAGWFLGLTGWFPLGPMWVDKGREVSFTAPSRLQIPGRVRTGYGAELGIAAGLHNSLRITYFQNKRAGTTTAANDLVLFSQPYYKGDELSVNNSVQDIKVSYEFLTLPYPVEARHFRFKTLFQMQLVNVKGVFDAPVKSATPDSSGALSDYSALGSKSIIAPTFGVGVHEYATRNFRFEANISGFMLPHGYYILDTDASMAFRTGHFELRAGGKAFNYRTTPNSDYFYSGRLIGAFVGVRWYTD